MVSFGSCWLMMDPSEKNRAADYMIPAVSDNLMKSTVTSVWTEPYVIPRVLIKVPLGLWDNKAAKYLISRSAVALLVSATAPHPTMVSGYPAHGCCLLARTSGCASHALTPSLLKGEHFLKHFFFWQPYVIPGYLRIHLSSFLAWAIDFLGSCTVLATHICDHVCMSAACPDLQTIYHCERTPPVLTPACLHFTSSALESSIVSCC